MENIFLGPNQGNRGVSTGVGKPMTFREKELAASLIEANERTIELLEEKIAADAESTKREEALEAALVEANTRMNELEISLAEAIEREKRPDSNWHGGWKIGICGVCAVTLALLAYALFGRPPYAFFSLLKYAVAASAGLGAWALYTESKRYLPVSICLLLIGGVHLFGRMRRSEWFFFNWSAVGILLVLLVALLITVLDHRATARLAHRMNEVGRRVVHLVSSI